MNGFDEGLAAGYVVGSTVRSTDRQASGRYCPHCYRRIPRDARFCCYCGRRM